MLLYHTGFQKIRHPDVHYGRRNADFGQGFYLTANYDFACRWAKERKGEQPVVNTYELDTEDLRIHRFSRDAAWFEYIFGNRSFKPDALDADVVIGPIVNDTLYDTFGIITSGFLKTEDAMRLLLIGPEYEQIVLKSERAAGNLRWLSAKELTEEEVRGYRETVMMEEKVYQELFAAELQRITGEE